MQTNYHQMLNAVDDVTKQRSDEEKMWTDPKWVIAYFEKAIRSHSFERVGHRDLKLVTFIKSLAMSKMREMESYHREQNLLQIHVIRGKWWYL